MTKYIELYISLCILALLTFLSCFSLTGCMSDAGWRVNFGVAPVKAIDDRAQLTQETKKENNIRRVDY